MTDLSLFSPDESSRVTEFGWRLPNGTILWGKLPLLELSPSSVIDFFEFERPLGYLNRGELDSVRKQYAERLAEVGFDGPVDVSKLDVVYRFKITAVSEAKVAH